MSVKIEIPMCEAKANELSIQRNVPYEDWLKIGAVVCRIQNEIDFWMGDWLRYGEQKYGEKYAQAMEMTGLEYETLANIKYVCDNVDGEHRVPGVHFSKHKIVASLPKIEQKRWLLKAKDEKLSLRKLREGIRGKNTTLRKYGCRKCHEPIVGVAKNIRVCCGCADKMVTLKEEV